MILINVFHKKILLTSTFIFFALSSSLLAGPDDEYLDWRDRPASLQATIDWQFKELQKKKNSSWGIYNGDASYGILDINEANVALKLLRDAHQEGHEDIWFLDVGAGNFQLGDSLAQTLKLSDEIPLGMHVNIIGIRGESYYGEDMVTMGPITLYKFGAFKIENLEEEFNHRNLNLRGKIDFIVSRWSMRHLVDPLGTWVQLYDLLRPKLGVMLMDWFYYLEENESLYSDDTKSAAFQNQRSHLLKLLNFIGDPFLIKTGNPSAKQTDQFILQKRHVDPLRIPLVYEETELCDRQLFDIGSSRLTHFKLIGSDFLKQHPLHDLIGLSSNDKSLYGDLNLFRWVKANNLGYTLSSPNVFDQLHYLNESLELTPLYSQEEIMERKRIILAEKEKETREEDHRKKANKAVLTELTDTRKKTPPHPYYEAGPLEYGVYSALRRGDFVSAQSYINQGANLERLFHFVPQPQTLLAYACSYEFPYGSIALLLKNNASIRTACLDDALRFRSEDDVFSLLGAGIAIENPSLALARSIERELYELVNYFVHELGFDVNAFISSRSMIYMAQYNERMWNHLIDLGAKGCFEETLEKKGCVN